MYYLESELNMDLLRTLRLSGVLGVLLLLLPHPLLTQETTTLSLEAEAAAAATTTEQSALLDTSTTLAPGNPCKENPCGNGICTLDYANR